MRMMKKVFLLFAAGMLTVASAQDYPPGIPEGQVTYDDVLFQSGESELPSEFIMGDPLGAPAQSSSVVRPITPAPSSNRNTSIDLNLYTLDYQVRGMGVTNWLSNYGWSHVDVSHTFANRNLLRRGIQHRVYGMAGVIWDASKPLGEVPVARLGYAVGKEVLPNMMVELGYNFRRGGLEGYMAKHHGRSSHRTTQDIALSVSYDDHQKGFFGHLECGAGFYGLTGIYFDAELGYRFTDVVRAPRMGADLEVSVGAAPSLSYWCSGAEGVDACRIKVALAPYSYKGAYGRDARAVVKPWVQCSWSCDNARKIDRRVLSGPVDHFQITFGVDLGWRF